MQTRRGKAIASENWDLPDYGKTSSSASKLISSANRLIGVPLKNGSARDAYHQREREENIWLAKESLFRRSSLVNERDVLGMRVLGRTLEAGIADEVENEQSEGENAESERVEKQPSGCRAVKCAIARTDTSLASTVIPRPKLTYKIPYSVAPIITVISAKINIYFPHSL